MSVPSPQVRIPLEAVPPVGSSGQGQGAAAEPVLLYSGRARLDETQPAIATPHSFLRPVGPGRVD